MITEMEITREIAAKVLEVVDAGLVSGVGNPVPGQMCVEAAVCYAMGLPHGDDPYTVSTVLRALKIRLNDSTWSSARSRATGLRRLAVAQLGSQGVLDDIEFGRRVVELAIRKQVPIALRAAAKMHPSKKQRAKLLAAAATCERQGTRQAADDAAHTAADAAAYAAADVAADAAYAAYASAAYGDIDYAAYAAEAAADVQNDRSLSEFAEDIVQILSDMNAPGCVWLNLTDAKP